MSFSILLVEDEIPAMHRLRDAVMQYNSSIQIAGACRSIAETVKWLQTHAAPDLILMDVQLQDGLSLEITKKISIPCPIIYITAHDTYVQEALEQSGIDYILKPLKQDRLATALNKYDMMRSVVVRSIHGQKSTTNKSDIRFIGRKGIDFVPVQLSDIAYFHSEFKLLHATLMNGQRLMLDQTLTELEPQISEHGFFRLNRQFLIHSRAVKRFSSIGKGKIAVVLEPVSKSDTIVSQEKANAFRQWISGNGSI